MESSATNRPPGCGSGPGLRPPSMHPYVPVNSDGFRTGRLIRFYTIIYPIRLIPIQLPQKSVIGGCFRGSVPSLRVGGGGAVSREPLTPPPLPPPGGGE